MKQFTGSDIDTFAGDSGVSDDFHYAKGKRKKKRAARKAKRKAKRAARKAKRKAKKAAKHAADNYPGDEAVAATAQQKAATESSDQESSGVGGMGKTVMGQPEAAAEEAPQEQPQSEQEMAQPAEEEAPEEAATEDEAGEEESDIGSTVASVKTKVTDYTVKYKKPIINFVLPAVGFGAGAMVGHKYAGGRWLVGGLIGAAVLSIPAIYDLASTKKEEGK